MCIHTFFIYIHVHVYEECKGRPENHTAMGYIGDGFCLLTLKLDCVYSPLELTLGNSNILLCIFNVFEIFRVLMHYFDFMLSKP